MGESQTITTGIRGLDAVLHGGLPRGRLNLVQGPTGSGKTTLALQFALAGVRNGERAAYVSLAETEPEIANIAASHGWSVEGLALFYQGPATSPESMAQALLHPAEVELPAILGALLDRVESFRPSRLVVDSLTELRILARETRWYRHELMRLRARLEALGCTALLLDTTEASQGVESLLGGVIRIERITPQYGPDRRRVHIVKMRGHDFETGYHDMRIRTGGVAVYPRLVAAQHRRRFSPKTVPTGLDALDVALGGGLDKGTAVLLWGGTGTGKSSVALQCAMAAAERGENVLMCVFDERIQTLFQRAEGLGMDLERQVEEGRIAIEQVDPAELTPGEFADNVKRHVDERGTELLILDSLNAYHYAMPEERLLDIHLHELLAYLSQLGVTSIIVATQHGRMDGAATSTSFDVSYLADTVIVFQSMVVGHRRIKTVSVHKRRAGTHDDALRELRLKPGSISVGEALARSAGTSGTPSATTGA